MVRLWASRMLHFTELPIYVMHTSRVNASTVLGPIDPFGKLRLQQVELIDLATRRTPKERRFLWTKLQAWRLPCERTALFDYDGWAVTAPDSIFNDCRAGASLCASREVWSMEALGRAAGTRRREYFNSGVLVLRPSNATFERLFRAAVEDQQQGAPRQCGEQDFLNVAFPSWEEIDGKYNVQAGRWRREPLDVGARSGRLVFVHERIARHNRKPAFERSLLCRPRLTVACRRGRDSFLCCRDSPHDEQVRVRGTVQKH